ncbi:MAG: HEAT repeat domain-containing protein [Planctomycetota bacterium]
MKTNGWKFLMLLSLINVFLTSCETLFTTGENIQDKNVQDNVTGTLDPKNMGTTVGKRVLDPLLNVTDALLPEAIKGKVSHEVQIQEHIRNLHTDRYESRHYAKQELAKYKSESVPYLLNALKTEDDYSVRREIVMTLSEIEEPAIPALITMLADKNWSNRDIAVEALADIGPKASSAEPHLIKLTKDENKNVRRSALKALGDIKATQPESITVLKAHLKHNDAESSIQAAEGLIKIRGSDSEALAVLIGILKSHTNPQVRSRIVQGFDNLNLGKSPEVVAALKVSVTDPDENVRYYATELLKSAK